MKKFRVDQRSFDLIKELLAAGLAQKKVAQAVGSSLPLVNRVANSTDYAAYETMRANWRKLQYERRHSEHYGEAPQAILPLPENPLPLVNDMSQLKQQFLDIASTLEKLGY